ncbi:MAG: sugar phosphate isomerase/epimerase [Clostridiales Family XIII bacterium]|jgi:sugar phosphate isomerase/epimerase|nr:sugar phosphate isomerase/epimerase [Clostridiales Family XIII bacterium]
MRHPVCLGYQIATPEVSYSADLTCLYGDVEQNIKLLKEIGYDAVEFMSVDPKQLNAEAYLKILNQNHMRAVMVCTGEVAGTLGLTFLDSDEQIRRRAINRVKEIIDFAAILGANVNIGRVRGMLDPKNGLDDTPAINAFREVSAYAIRKNVDILIEPIEKPDENYINTIADGVKVKNALDQENFKVMMDYSAMCFEEDSIADAVERFAAADVAHIHLSEKERDYPGYLDIKPFESFIAQLAKTGYTGPFVLEVYSIPDQKTAAEKSFEAIAPILEQHYGWRSVHHGLCVKGGS